MSNSQKQQPEARKRRVTFTARLSLAAYEAMTDIQRQHRIQSGKALPLWRILDTAVLVYAQQQKDAQKTGA